MCVAEAAEFLPCGRKEVFQVSGICDNQFHSELLFHVYS